VDAMSRECSANDSGLAVAEPRQNVEVNVKG
jgi:hypothetical protein